MVPQRKESRSVTKRIGDKLYKKQVKYNVSTIQEKQTGTASKTYDVTLKEQIAKGNLQTNRGIAKKIVGTGNASAENIGLINDSNPRMLARQVASWKVARALDLRVLSTEKYALNDDGKLIGVSAIVPNARSLSAETKFHLAQLDQQNKTSTEREAYFAEHVFTPSIQKQLSDLQLIDALTGQTDRHHGNIFIDTQNEKIFGIDNDQAFINNKNRSLLNFNNAMVSWEIPTVAALDKFGSTTLTNDPSKDLIYLQSQIDADTAEKVLALDSKRLRQVLEDRVGRAHGEYLTDDEINAAEKRLKAIKKRIKELKDDGKLISEWNDSTYMDSIETYGGTLPFLKGDVTNEKTNGQRHQNYIAREIYGMVHNIGENGAFRMLEIGKPMDEVRSLMNGEPALIKEQSNYIEVTKYVTRNDILLGRKGLTEDEISAFGVRVNKAAAEARASEARKQEEGYSADSDISARKARVKARARKARAKARARKAK